MFTLYMSAFLFFILHHLHRFVNSKIRFFPKKIIRFAILFFIKKNFRQNSFHCWEYRLFLSGRHKNPKKR